VTGAAGYIGSHICRVLLNLGYEVVALDNFSRGWRQALELLKSENSSLKVVEADLRQAEIIKKIMLDERPDLVFHFAALCSVNESMHNPYLYFSNNCQGTFNLLEAMRLVGVDKIIFSSTSAVYGEAKSLPIKEDQMSEPVNPYGESKLLIEKSLKWFGQLYGLNYVILRYFNVCGSSSDGYIGDSKKPSQLLVQNAVRGALGLEQFHFTCPHVPTPDGTPIRDYIDVEDLIDAHLTAADYLNNGGQSDIFNLGNGQGYSVREIVETVEKVLDVKLSRQADQTRQGEIAEIYADVSKAKQILNWQAKKSLSDSIVSLVAWYKRYPKGYDY